MREAFKNKKMFQLGGGVIFLAPTRSSGSCFVCLCVPFVNFELILHAVSWLSLGSLSAVSQLSFRCVWDVFQLSLSCLSAASQMSSSCLSAVSQLSLSGLSAVYQLSISCLPRENPLTPQNFPYVQWGPLGAIWGRVAVVKTRPVLAGW